MMDINFMVVFGSGFVGGCGISFAFYTLFASRDGYKKDIARKPVVKLPKTDFTEMCQACFCEMVSKMPSRTICNLQEVERQRMLGCSHRRKTSSNEPDFSATPPKVVVGDYND